MAGEVYEDPQWIHNNWKMCNIHIPKEKSDVEPSKNVEIVWLIYSLNECLVFRSCLKLIKLGSEWKDECASLRLALSHQLFKLLTLWNTAILSLHRLKNMYLTWTQLKRMYHQFYSLTPNWCSHLMSLNFGKTRCCCNTALVFGTSLCINTASMKIWR